MKSQELALFRKEQGLSLTSLGRLLKMRSSTLSDYEKGKYPIPKDREVYIESFIKKYRQSEESRYMFKDVTLPPVELSKESLQAIEDLIRKVVTEIISSPPKNGVKPYDPLEAYRRPPIDDEITGLRERCKTNFLRG